MTRFCCRSTSSPTAAGFGPVDLTVTRGEIVGIAGAEGNGQVQFMRALAGVEPSKRFCHV